jgi:hypothetical protein
MEIAIGFVKYNSEILLEKENENWKGRGHIVYVRSH